MAGAGFVLLLAYVVLALAVSGMAGEAASRALPFATVLLCVAGGVGGFLSSRNAADTSLRHALLGTALLFAAPGCRLLYAPSWPALSVLALGVAAGLGFAGGGVTARVLALAAALAELVAVLGPRRDVVSVLVMAVASAAVPLLVEGMARAWRMGLEERASAAVDQRLRELDQDARDYRLIGASARGALAPADAAQRRTRGSVTAVRESIYGLLELLARVMNPHTVALLLLDANGKTLRVAELVTRSDFMLLKDLPADKGVPGTVLKKAAPLALQNVGADFMGVTWYHPPQQVNSVLAVPVREGEHLRGLLVCDWMVDRPLSDGDTATLAMFAREVERAMENERAFKGADQARHEEAALFRASQDFVKVADVPQTLATAAQSACQVAGATAALLVLKDGDAWTVAAQHGLDPALVGRPAVDEFSMLRTVMDSRTPGPMGLWDAKRIGIMLGPQVPLAGLDAVRMFPLEEEQKPLGVLVLLHNKKGAFVGLPDDGVQTVMALSGLALSNRRMFEKMEKMATTDGLTGLLNHRTFQDRASEALGRAIRYKKPLGLILTDIDHFKNVNDTYGHPVGDEVIRQVSAVLKAVARTTDVVARYGGEEFAVVMEETDAQGGLMVAERIRQAVQKVVVTTDMGPLKVTLSLGVASYPLHGQEKHILIERADQALYTAKHSGRNRAVIASTPQPADTPVGQQPEKA